MHKTVENVDNFVDNRKTLVSNTWINLSKDRFFVLYTIFQILFTTAGGSYDKIGENKQKEERTPWNFGITCKYSLRIKAFAG